MSFVRCQLCFGNHQSAACEQYRTVDERSARIIGLGRCPRCLCPGHNGTCRSVGPCKICYRNHHIVLCPQKLNKGVVCPFCDGSHWPSNCGRYISVQDRRTVALQRGLCERCLTRVHAGRKCASTKRCGLCSGQHHIALCTAAQPPSKLKKSDQAVSRASRKQELPSRPKPSDGTEAFSQDATTQQSSSTKEDSFDLADFGLSDLRDPLASIVLDQTRLSPNCSTAAVTSKTPDESCRTTFRGFPCQSYTVDSCGRIVNYDAVANERSLFENCESNIDLLDSPVIRSWMDNIAGLSFVLDALQTLASKHPKGLSSQEFADFEQLVASSERHWPQHSSLSSLHSLIAEDLLLVNTGRLEVNPRALDVTLLRLSRNLPSNVYRFLVDNGGCATMREIEQNLCQISHADEGISLEDVLHLCNHFPTIFHLHCPSENRLLLDATVTVDVLIRWRVVLDAEFLYGDERVSVENCAYRKCPANTHKQPLTML